ncbi:rhodanese-like domain-containing protein [Desulfocurvibacter africanus]|uniref:rhodanese-like domain-containing protein n=1 Tax=Desulfocurvibacter africanus TaxID=873 RepID=UPI00047FF6F7|nr:rhodanese-like domain-containing protein [Desulfocurvibacter africanus]
MSMDVHIARSDSATGDWVLDRKVFLLESLAEITRELAGQATPAGIIRAFLPMAMGPLGLTWGFIALCTPDGQTLAQASRGLETPELSRLAVAAPSLSARFFTTPEAAGAAPPDPGQPPVLLTGQHLGRNGLLPESAEALAVWSVDQDLRGLAILGGRLTDALLDAEEVVYLEKLIGNISMAVRCAGNAEAVARMSRVLAERTERLEKAMAAMATTQDELDRRNFHLSVLFETTRELSGELDPARAMDTFLKTVAGSFGLERAFLAVLDDADDVPALAALGLSEQERALLVTPSARQTLLGLFVASKDRMPHPLESRILAQPPTGLPGEPRIVLLFAVDEQCRGVLALGPRISGREMARAEQELLQAQLDSFMLSLDGARQHETAKRLNLNLSQRNSELIETIAQLTNAKKEIDLLQAAKMRIAAALRGEMERLKRFSWRDLILILLASLCLGLLYNLVSPGRVEIVPKALFNPGPPAVTAFVVKAELDAGRAVLIDARPAEFFQQESIPGAVNLTPALFDFVYAMRFADLPLDAPIIVYGRSVSLLYDRQVAEKLSLRGHESVVLLDGGLDAWRKAGFSLESKEAKP